MHNEDMSSTVENIRALRQAGLTQVDIAKRSGVPQCRISRWEGGGVPRAADDALKLDELARSVRGHEKTFSSQSPAVPSTNQQGVADA